MNTTEAPAYIARSTHAGTWTRTIASGAHRADSFTAAELAEMATGELVIWESAGHMRSGQELFVRSRYLPQGDGSLAGYDADGRRIITHPAGRSLRVLTR